MPVRAPRRLGDLLRRIAGLWEPALLAVTVAALLIGGICRVSGATGAADALWITGIAVGLVPTTVWVLDALRRLRLGVDVLAWLSLIGTLAVGEYLAGALIAVMVATGQFLDAAAERRAGRDLQALAARAATTARRRDGDQVTVVPVGEITVGDAVLIGPGEVVPVDGWLESDRAVIDESALTGEPLAVTAAHGDPIRSGTVNAGPAFELQARAAAADSTYAGIVELARQAASDSAPIVRIADRVAGWFLPVALIVAGTAWAVTQDPVRAVAVLVVATPCPLLLAAPVAIVSGISRASRVGVVVRGGAVLETLGYARTLVLDKTGTLTTGRPTGTDVLVAPGREPDAVLALAASADQLSPHVLAEAIVREARARELPLTMPENVHEDPGVGVTALVGGTEVFVGSAELAAGAPAWARAARARAALDGAAVAWVHSDGEPIGAILLVDPVRRDAVATLRRLREAGLDRQLMLTGDRREPAEEIGAVLGLDAVHAEQSPADKVARVRAEQDRAVTVMVGDGINDAPALAAADVGVAMGARGATAASEAADVVLTTDRLANLAEAMTIARRSRTIALQSAVVGMTLSAVAMVVAALGWLPPAAGALMQEGIDIAVIVNALRALRGRTTTRDRLPAETDQLLRAFSAEHEQMRDRVAVLRETAGLVSSGELTAAHSALRRADAFLFDVLLPHERAEEQQLYPTLADSLGGAEAIATITRMHTEIDRLARRLRAHLTAADARGSISDDQVDDLLACLYGLYAVVRMHFLAEEENYFSLATAAD